MSVQNSDAALKAEQNPPVVSINGQGTAEGFDGIVEIGPGFTVAGASAVIGSASLVLGTINAIVADSLGPGGNFATPSLGISVYAGPGQSDLAGGGGGASASLIESTLLQAGEIAGGAGGFSYYGGAGGTGGGAYLTVYPGSTNRSIGVSSGSGSTNPGGTGGAANAIWNTSGQSSITAGFGLNSPHDGGNASFNLNGDSALTSVALSISTSAYGTSGNEGSITGSNLTTLTSFSLRVTWPYPANSSFGLDFSGTILDQGSVDSICVACDVAMASYAPYGMYLGVAGGCAAPSSTGLAAIADLVANGNTVAHN